MCGTWYASNVRPASERGVRLRPVAGGVGGSVELALQRRARIIRVDGERRCGRGRRVGQRARVDRDVRRGQIHDPAVLRRGRVDVADAIDRLDEEGVRAGLERRVALRGGARRERRSVKPAVIPRPSLMCRKPMRCVSRSRKWRNVI